MTRDRYRVLFVASHPVQYQAPLFRRMSEHPRLDIQVAYCTLQGAEAGIDEEFGVDVKWDVPLLEGYPWVRLRNRSPRPGLGRFFGLINPELWKMIRAGEYDAVVLYTGYVCASFWITALAARRNGTPMLFGTDATSLEPRSGQRWRIWFKKLLLPTVFRMAAVAIAPSSATAEYLQSLGIAAERIVVTPFVVDNDYWKSRSALVDKAAVRSAWGCSNSEPVVLFCAKLQPWKRPQDVLRAFGKANVPDALLIMAGEGDMREQLVAEAKHLGIAERVKFLGFVNQSELPALYSSADVMVLPSKYDPCPAVVCEAMLCGCPVILSDTIRGRRELVRPQETGLIYPCGNVDSLAETLRKVLSNRDQLSQLSKAARNRMESWSPVQNIQALVQALDKACISAVR
jgi:glycosyltransferase involved in cell wall biosynthesis